MPRRVPPEAWKSFDAMIREGVNVSEASRRVGIDRSTGALRVRSQKKRDGTVHAAVMKDLNVPEIKKAGKLSGEAERALVDFDFFRLRFTGRASMPWQVEAANAMVAYLETEDREFVVVNVPPGAGKSTLFTHDIPLWLICRNRAIRILIGSRTERQAKMYTGRLMDSLERTSPYLATDGEKRNGTVDAASTVTEDYGRFKPTEPKVWRREELTVAQPNDVAASDKENTLAAYGKDGGVLGGRFDLVIWDDLVDPKNQATIEARDELKTWWKTIAQTRVEPGGLCLLQGQRIGPDDLYRYALDMTDIVLDEDGEEVETETPPKKYKHIIYRAHYEDRCTGKHPRKSEPWPVGCLLDPYRLPWRDLASTAANGIESFLVGYQQEDVDPADVLVQKLWVTGGKDERGVEYPGCWDNDRGLMELPYGLKGDLFSYATVDPSPSNFWAVQHWCYHAESEQRFLMNLVRTKMPARGLLDWDIDAGRLVGLMPEWQQASIDIGVPISYWIVEANAAQKWLAVSSAGDRFLRKFDTQIVRHFTNVNKGDAKLGVSSLSTLYAQGRVRLPGANRGNARISSLKLVDEVTRYPHASTDDEVMAQWFGEWNLKTLYTPTNVAAPRIHAPWAYARRGLELVG